MALCSDFGATLDLIEKEAGNCSVNYHAVARVVYAARGRKVEHDAKDNHSNAITKKESQVDRRISFAGTLSKGKKNDHLARNAFLNHANYF